MYEDVDVYVDVDVLDDVLVLAAYGEGDAPRPLFNTPSILEYAEDLCSRPKAAWRTEMVLSRFVEVEGHRVHYIEEGNGDPVLFVHGNPTSSYLWRNVLPPVAAGLKQRAIAIDLLGFGRSEKPDVAYSLPFHARILEGFIETLKLRNISLVLHDWGGAIGMGYASRHPQNIRAVAAMETFLWNVRFEDFPAKWQGMFKLMRTPLGFLMLQGTNMAAKMIGGAVLPSTRLPDSVLDEYKRPFPSVTSRRASREFARMLLLKGKPATSRLFLEQTEAQLAQFTAPICLIRATPGTDYSDHLIARLTATVPQLEPIDFGPGGHYLQEDDPVKLSKLLTDWFRRVSPSR